MAARRPRLREEEKASILLFREKGVSYRAIAKILGRSAETIRLFCDSQAREAHNRRVIQRAKDHPEVAAAWRASNPEYFTEWGRQNRSRRNAQAAARRRLNPEKTKRLDRQTNRTRRVRRLQAPTDGHTLAQAEAHMARWHGHCAYCFETPEILSEDHVVPLSRGGAHALWNIVPACLSCNSAKRDRLPGSEFQLPREPAT